MAVKIIPQEQINSFSNELKRTLANWENHQKYGCNDPFWSDSTNMNLLRNHMFYFKKSIAELCYENDIKLPPEYFLPIPPQVDSNYFADLTSPRAKKIIEHSAHTEKVKKPKFNADQLVLF